MAEYLYPDICVIGAGPAGLAVAAFARRHGAGVIVVEREALGGNDLHHGTVPARALAEAARRAHQARTAGAFGIVTGEPRADLAGVREHVVRMTGGMAMSASAARYEAIGARLIKAEARFTDPRTLDAGGVRIRARRFVLATGSEPVPPELPGLEAVEHFTEDSIFANAELPQHLAVIGGDAFALELAQAYRRFGAEVTLVVPLPLAGLDPELAEVLLRRLREEGVVLRSGPVSALAPGPHLTLANGEVLAASHVLVVRGRRPALAAIDLDAAGIRRDSADPSRVAVRPDLTTSNARIYAIGDAAGGGSGQLALQQAELVARAALFGARARSAPERLARTVFTDPELAEVGLTEATAGARLGPRFSVLRAGFAENLRARLGLRSYGLVKLIAGRDGRILGAGIVGPEAAELISLFAFAMQRNHRVRDLAGFFAPYPTLAEIAPALARADADARGQQENPVRAALLAFRRVLP